MQYTVAISEKPGGQWQAIVTDLPYCTAEAPTNGLQNGHAKKSVAEEWPGFGSHPNDPDWGDFFDELDRQRQ
ncbi:MAG: hypothetical protein AAB401_01615 [Acidobacteriota bacterium]